MVIKNLRLRNLPIADVTRFIGDLKEMATIVSDGCHRIAEVEAARDRAIVEIEQRFSLYHAVFDGIFEERRTGIDACFKVIEDGIKNNKNQQVLAGLQQLGNIVCSSPFKDFERLSRALEGEGEVIEI